MNIKDIAKMAGVSITTVSKVINKKDGDINIDTRNKILKIVKEYNYVPYGNKILKTAEKSYIIALLLKDVTGNSALIEGVIKIAKENSYSIMIYDSANSEADEEKNAMSIIKHGIDAVIWEPVGVNSTHLKKSFDNNQIKIIAINTELEIFRNTYSIDYKKMGYEAANLLLKQRHTKIGCLLNRDSYRSKCILEGVKQSLFENNMVFDDKGVLYEESISHFVLKDCELTALICSHEKLCSLIVSLFQKQNIKIPTDISLISVQETEVFHEGQNFSTFKIPYGLFGEFIAKQLFSALDGGKTEEKFCFTNLISSNNSIDMPLAYREKNILVVGSANVDIFFNVDNLPAKGKTISVDESMTMAGGKAVNQAIGIAKLNKKVSLLCSVGVDYKSTFIVNALEKNQIDTDTMVFDKKRETGVAYIHVNQNGDSTITIVKGANSGLSKKDILQKEVLFANAQICLLQTEVPEKTILEAAKMAKKYGAMTILKPSTLKQVNEEIFKYIDIIIPNENEANQLFPNITLKEQAEEFIRYGIKKVIITLAEKGCYYCDGSKEQHFSAPDVKVIDATGAADAFISTLAVFLSERQSIEEAIIYASAAAGCCITQFGATDTAIDRDTLEQFWVRKMN